MNLYIYTIYSINFTVLNLQYKFTVLYIYTIYTIYSLLRESHGQRSLVGYSPRGRKESDTTEQLHFRFQVYNSILSLQKVHALILKYFIAKKCQDYCNSNVKDH